MIFEDELDLLGFSEEENDNMDEIGDLIGPNGHMARNHPLSALDKVLLAQRFYASGSFYYVIGDTAGPTKKTIGRAVTQVIFNIRSLLTVLIDLGIAAHKRTRSLIECAIGQLKNSWRCLSKLRVKDPAYAAEIIKAVIVLHNRRMDQNPEDLPTQEEEQEDECPPEEMGTTEARAAGKQKQIDLINFFVR
ncbi:DDE superfamily endonuclease domain-containing protein [Ditylenchus destructor]|uniref:DDE superfamily endonuclease domain-containing protein n=1 Tax=Ditylenchus destructor TaxID=166010 RepID=A0AAD4NAD8_9BILA|nr:DDE superfamily endonuclease domain-containing protein [Ditylenchus destructor]